MRKKRSESRPRVSKRLTLFEKVDAVISIRELLCGKNIFLLPAYEQINLVAGFFDILAFELMNL